MTREEEIRERLEGDNPTLYLVSVDEDVRYLLAENERLRERLEKAGAVVRPAKMLLSNLVAADEEGLLVCKSIPALLSCAGLDEALRQWEEGESE